MPHVEVLPNSTASAAPGWHYVVDTGYDPSKVAINPKDRKRIAARAAGAKGENELSARQQTSIARRIAELDKDNDIQKVVTVPGGLSAPKTPSTRKILSYSRQIKHWLDDEEAQLLQAPPPRAATGLTSRGAVQSGAPRRQSTLPSIPPTPSELTPHPAASSLPPSTPFGFQEEKVDPLLSIERLMPAPLNPAELEALLSAPPLPYAASHVAPPPAGGPPQRHFCDNCGYWGKIKCLKCGARVCGLECKDAHEATRCLKWA